MLNESINSCVISGVICGVGWWIGCVLVFL